MDMYGQRRYKDWIDSQRRQALHLVGTENNINTMHSILSHHPSITTIPLLVLK